MTITSDRKHWQFTATWKRGPGGGGIKLGRTDPRFPITEIAAERTRARLAGEHDTHVVTKTEIPE